MAVGDSKAHGNFLFSKGFLIFLMKALKEMFTLEPPPTWFDILQGNQLDFTRRPELSNHVSPKAGKSSRLNQKRVGAAWAERRKLELELEKRGEPLTHTFRANWLPNFCRVWQSGTRKDSRKEAQMENTLSYKEDVQSENHMPLQPYISKKMPYRPHKFRTGRR